MSAVRAAVALLAALVCQAAGAGQARTVDIGMFDSMRFAPAELTVTSGETIRFVVRNGGLLQHEIVIGTHDEIARWRHTMHAMHAMHHDHAMAGDMLHVAPGEREQLTRQFALPGELEYACLLPGHYEAGMHGTIAVLPHPAPPTP